MAASARTSSFLVKWLEGGVEGRSLEFAINEVNQELNPPLIERDGVWILHFTNLVVLYSTLQGYGWTLLTVISGFFFYVLFF